ncbi:MULTISPECIES: NUDIX domain-containing protein [Ramlibacter]|uniref:NUDIX domain-containing protein n=1 Tax=Ramlibacter pinisoli TaxID=2682844 RepID=A0A6N8J010_9BURK|nr:NUDIX domain-containing protein [Ramlibacter sp. CGMCC 1.13660]MVQ32437.1 NUDIX domain-containing protein [Ramlibacter pinisoli]
MSGFPALPAGWLAGLRARLDRPPAQPRLPLRWRGHAIGSVEPQWVAGLHAAAPTTVPLLRPAMDPAGPGYLVDGADLTTALQVLADAMRAAGRAHAWRDEQLAVAGEDGAVLGSIERAAVRPLGIATRAVHLLGQAGSGHWIQQRALDKPTDPGLWDTLMGGMVPARDAVAEALQRETWEEAGLRLDQLEDLQRGGAVLSRGPAGEVAGGYVVEVIDWYRARVPDGVAPVNQDGEVAQFRLVGDAELVRMLVADEFTLEAAGVFAAAAA